MKISDMTKLFLCLTAMLMMAACGNNKSRSSEDADSEAETELTEQDDDEEADWEAQGQKEVTAMLKAVYKTENELMDTELDVNLTALDQKFCSKEFLELQGEVASKSLDAQSPEEAFSDEGWRWIPGIAFPVSPKNIRVEMIQKDRAEARFTLSDDYGNKAAQHLVLVKEDGKWKIHNWIDEDAYPEGNYLDWMKSYLDVQVGDVLVAPDEDWTEEAVEKQIRKIYSDVNRVYVDNASIDLDAKYCTKDWNEVYRKVNEKDERQRLAEKRYFVDDQHWTLGIHGPLKVKDISVELTTGTTAEATYELVAEDGFSASEMVLMEYEKGQWRIDDWGDDRGGVTMKSRMNLYLEE